MGYRAYVRVVNEIEYGNSLGFAEPENLLEDLELLEEESGKMIIQWQDEYNDDLEINYKNFIEAFEKYYTHEKYRMSLENLYNEAKESYSCKKEGVIRVDWF